MFQTIYCTIMSGSSSVTLQSTVERSERKAFFECLKDLYSMILGRACSTVVDDELKAQPRGLAECACSATSALYKALFGPDGLCLEKLAFVVVESALPAEIPWTQ